MLNTIQDEKDCKDMAKLQDEIHHLVIGLNKAKRRNDLPYIDTLKSEIKSREKQLEKLRRF